MGKPSSQQTSTQTSTPWSGVQPYMTDYLSKAQQATNQPYNFYNGSTVAGFSPEQQAGMNLGTNRALAGSPALNSANTSITDTLNGNYLSPDSNPYLKQNVNTALDDVQSRVNSQFSGNNYGSSANQELLAKNLGQTAAGMYGQNFTNERNNMMQAANLAPTLANADYLDANQLQNIGAQRQGLSQQYLNAASGQFNNAQQYPFQQLQRYGQAIGGINGGGTTTTSAPNPNQQSALGNLAGLGMSAYGLYSAMNPATAPFALASWIP